MRTHLTALLSLTTLVAMQPPARQPTPPRQPRVVRLTPAEATRLAREVRRSVSVEMAAGLEVTPWAPDRLVADPVGIDVDGRGVVYVTSSGRSIEGLDIRGHPDW